MESKLRFTMIEDDRGKQPAGGPAVDWNTWYLDEAKKLVAEHTAMLEKLSGDELEIYKANFDFDCGREFGFAQSLLASKAECERLKKELLSFQSLGAR